MQAARGQLADMRGRSSITEKNIKLNAFVHICIALSLSVFLRVYVYARACMRACVCMHMERWAAAETSMLCKLLYN